MRNKRNARYPIVVILGTAHLIIGAALISISGGHAFAQSAGPMWTYTGNLNVTRSEGPTATLLTSGKVLVVGGRTCSGGNCFTLNSAELYDPATGKWSFTGTLNTGRDNHTATLLTDGKVLVAGGESAGFSI